MLRWFMDRRDVSSEPLPGGGRSDVRKRDNTIIRPVAPWTTSIHALLRHLETVGFEASPRLVGDGYDGHGNEVLAYVEGEQVHPHAWTDEGVHAVGVMLRGLHDATGTFEAPAEAVWQPYHFRGGPDAIIGHGDVSPWNILAVDGRPRALIDWEFAGPIDRVDEIAQAGWLNAQLHDDDVAERFGFPDAAARAKQLRLLLDGYRMPRAERINLVGSMINYAIRDCAREAIEGAVTPDSVEMFPLWAMAWRARSAAWMLRHQSLLERTITG
jgi:hypothetical protein